MHTHTGDSFEDMGGGRRIVVAAVGDVMLADQNCCFGFGIRSRYAPDRYADLLRDERIVRTFSSADLSIANLECTLVDEGSMRFASHVMAMERNGIRFLRRMGIDVVTLANNHAVEHGASALGELKRSLALEGISHLGCKNPLILDVKGVAIGLLSYNTVPNCGKRDLIAAWDDSHLASIESLSQDVDFLLVCLHWGNEFMSHPSPEQVALGHKVVDAGARLVLGSHPHVLQPVERYGKGLICYSLGNFLFDNYCSSAVDTPIFVFEIDTLTDYITFDIVPIVSSLKDFSLKLADEETADRMRRSLHTGFVDFPTEGYEKRVYSQRQLYRRTTCVHVCRNLLRYRDRLQFLRWAARRLWLVLSRRGSERMDPQEVYKWN